MKIYILYREWSLYGYGDPSEAASGVSFKDEVYLTEAGARAVQEKLYEDTKEWWDIADFELPEVSI